MTKSKPKLNVVGLRFRKALPGKSTPLWLDTTPGTRFPVLRSNLSVDVAVIGGGIAGITAAVLLKEAGATVALLEANRVVRGVSGHTTAKVTSQHTLIYQRLIRSFGKEHAQLYADANESALKTIASFVETKRIACDFMATAAYVFGESENARKAIATEVKAAQSLGLPASFTEDVPLPIKTFGGMRFSNQAQFHPRKYLLALCRDIPGDGSHIFENTRALEIKDGPHCSVVTQEGSIRAHHIIVATHFPAFDRSYYYARMKTIRSYVLAARLKSKPPEGMFISSKDTFHSFRSQPFQDGELFFIGGEGHETGKGGDTLERYQRLAAYARQQFSASEIVYRWSTQDYETEDGVPYVGKLSPGSKRLYVITGFGGWGMTNATAGAAILRDAILGRRNDWSVLYDPGRYKPKASLKQPHGRGQGAGQDSGDERQPVTPRASSLSGIPVESGKVLSLDGEKVAIFRDAEGKLHAMSAVCSHMGCTVVWNTAEKSWDCPCHGSRFNAEGKVIQTPAITDLPKRSIDTR